MRHANKRKTPEKVKSGPDYSWDPELMLRRMMKGEYQIEDDWAEKNLPKLGERLFSAYQAYGDLDHLEGKDLPSKEATIKVLDDFMAILFPSLLGNSKLKKSDIKDFLKNTLHSLYILLVEEIDKSLKYICRRVKECPKDVCRRRAQIVTTELLESIPRLRDLLEGDIHAAYEGDPAAKSYEEIVLSYPCVYAIATHRIAHELHTRGVPFLPRIMSEHAHSITGIDIHPGSEIGKNFFIDHGTGVVIGETTKIGDNVRIYQGVTLGGQSFSRGEVAKLRGRKRHPTIKDEVIIYAGATILGGQTAIGRGATIGGNVWITSSIPPNTKVIIEPPKLTYKTKKNTN